MNSEWPLYQDWHQKWVASIQNDLSSEGMLYCMWKLLWIELETNNATRTVPYSVSPWCGIGSNRNFICIQYKLPLTLAETSNPCLLHSLVVHLSSVSVFYPLSEPRQHLYGTLPAWCGVGRECALSGNRVCHKTVPSASTHHQSSWRTCQTTDIPFVGYICMKTISTHVCTMQWAVCTVAPPFMWSLYQTTPPVMRLPSRGPTK